MKYAQKAIIIIRFVGQEGSQKFLLSPKYSITYPSNRRATEIVKLSLYFHGNSQKAFFLSVSEAIIYLISRKYYFAKDKIKVDPAKLDDIMGKVPQTFAEYKLDRTDGIKVLGDNFWIHIRKSGTEPIIRVYVESETPQRSEELCKNTIEKLIGK